jgi:hypothetical protein
MHSWIHSSIYVEEQNSAQTSGEGSTSVRNLQGFIEHNKAMDGEEKPHHGKCLFTFPGSLQLLV